MLFDDEQDILVGKQIASSREARSITRGIHQCDVGVKCVRELGRAEEED